MDEVLKDDPLFGQIGVVDELADVGPGRDELRRLFADGIVRSLGRVQFLELTLELLPFPLEPGQAFPHQIDGVRPELRQRADEVVDLAVDRDEAVADERDFLFYLFGVFAQGVQGVPDNLLTGLRVRPDPPQQPLYAVLQCDCWDAGAGALRAGLLVDLAGALVVVTGPRPTRRPLRRHVVPAGAKYQPLEWVLPTAGVAGAGTSFAVLVEDGPDAGRLLRGDDRRVGVLGADLSPDDVAEVDGVLQDPHHLLLLEGPLAAPFLTAGFLGRVADPQPVEALEHPPDGAEFLHSVVDVLADDFGLVRVRHEPFGLLVLAVAEDEAAVPVPVLGTPLQGLPGPLADHQPLVLGEAHGDVVGQEVGRRFGLVSVVEELEVHFVLLEQRLEVAEVDRVPADPVHLEREDQVESPRPHVGLEPFHFGSVEVLAGSPGLDVVGDGPDRHLLLPPLLDVAVGQALLGFERHALAGLHLGRDSDVHADPQGTGLCPEEESSLQFHRYGPS